MRFVKIAVLLLTAGALTAVVSGAEPAALDLPNRIPEAAPYVTEEARALPPPYEEYWQTQNHPGQCQTCHQRIFDEWNGSMMSNTTLLRDISSPTGTPITIAPTKPMAMRKQLT